jgi:hypothetical protein
MALIMALMARLRVRLRGRWDVFWIRRELGPVLASDACAGLRRRVLAGERDRGGGRQCDRW